MLLRPPAALLLALAGCDLAADDDPARALLRAVNDTRRTARVCGTEAFAAAGPLAWDDRLAAAAARHSADLAAHRFGGHVGTDGSGPADRVAAAGFPASALGEVVAVGDGNARTVVRGWLASPAHCRVLMDGRFTHAGAAVAGRRYRTLDAAALR